jgi:histidine ammonia-lyase
MAIEVGSALTTSDVAAVAEGAEVSIAPHVRDPVDAARRVVEEALHHPEHAVYGINTGFGYLANVRIPANESERLQHDIVRSHATAVGPPLPLEVVRAMLLLKARTFAFGISGVRYALIEALVALLNARVHPVVPSQGSLGASGDLALLAHLALPLMGEGEAELDGEVMSGAAALERAGLEPLLPSHKEGLSLVNGTEGMLALGILALERVERLARAADVTGAMTVEACLGTDQTFRHELVGLRRHPGALVVARNLRGLLAGSPIVASHRESEHMVQDAYSLRCIPQVHGAYRDGIAHVRETIEAELGSAVDNPSVLVDEGAISSSGNFHGESLALALDHLCLCAAGFSTISERRIARLVDPELNNGLPAFLTTDPGRRSGFMLAQYTAASLVAESRSLCMPSSADSIPTSAGQEDHVSMGMTSARKAWAIAENTGRVLAIEALAAAQGLDLRAPLKPAAATEAAHDHLRTVSPQLDEDRSLAPDIESTARALAAGAVQKAVAAHVSLG